VVAEAIRIRNMKTEHSEHLEDAVAAIPSGRRFWQHVREPRNLGKCRNADSSAIGVGSCGDKIQVDLRVKEDILAGEKCATQGCVHTVGCASDMSVLAMGCSIDKVLKLQPEDVVNELGGLPEDHLHCARLAINTLGEAIADYYHGLVNSDREANRCQLGEDVNK